MRLLLLIILIFTFNLADAKGKHFIKNGNNRYLDTAYIYKNSLEFKTKSDIKPLIQCLFHKYKFVFPDGELDDTLAIDSTYNGFIGENAEIKTGRKVIMLLKSEQETDYNSIDITLWDKKTVFPHDTSELFAAIINVFEEVLNYNIVSVYRLEDNDNNYIHYNIKELLNDRFNNFEDSIYLKSGMNDCIIDFHASFNNNLKHLEFKCSNNAAVASAIIDFIQSPSFNKILDTIHYTKISINGNFFINKEKRYRDILTKIQKFFTDSSYKSSFVIGESTRYANDLEDDSPQIIIADSIDKNKYTTIYDSIEDLQSYGNIFSKNKTHAIINLVDQIRIYEIKKDTSILKFNIELTDNREVTLQNLNADSIPEILISTSHNMNGNSWFDVISYDTLNDTFINSGELCCDYGYSIHTNYVYSNHYGSYYMPVYHEIYKWDNYKLNLIEKIETVLIQNPFQWETFTTYYKADKKGVLQPEAIGWGDEKNMIKLMKRFKNDFGYEEAE